MEDKINIYRENGYLLNEKYLFRTYMVLKVEKGSEHATNSDTKDNGDSSLTHQHD